MADAIVNNMTQLSAAVTDMNIDVIYFDSDIELTAPITIPPTKPSLIFDGTYNGVRHRFTDMSSTSSADTIAVREGSSIALTFRNMDMTGRNYYGIPCIFESATSGVSLTYNDITYTGPQLVFNPMGLTHFENCDITISASAVTNAEEVGEVCRVEFAGTNTINHTSTSDAVFWFRGDTNAAYFRVLAGASVNIDTDNYFMYARDLSTFVAKPVAYEIRNGADFTLNSHRGIAYDSGHRISSFLVDTNANFHYTQEIANGSVATMYINGALTVNDGASMYMQADFASSQPLINFIEGTNLQVTLNNPKSFVLYDRASAPIAITTFMSRNYSILTHQLNHWTTATAFPNAGTFTDTPQNKWNNLTWTSFTVTGSITPTGTTASSSGLVTTTPPITNFNYQNARVISAGNLPIDPDPMIDNGRALSGQTNANAQIRISFTLDGTTHTFNTTADSSGRYTIDPGMALPVGTAVTISANTPFLITTISESVVSEGELTLISAPVRIEFHTPPILLSPILLGRDDPSREVLIRDTRPYPTDWELFASISGPLQTAAGDTLNNAVVFRDPDGTLRELGAVPILVYTGVAYTGDTSVVWDPDRGILVRITQPIRCGIPYTTDLYWTLIPIEEP